MGAVKAVGQLYGSPTALTSQHLAWDHYCTYVVQTPRVESQIFLEQIRYTCSTRTTRGRPVNTSSAAEFTFFCVYKPNKRPYEEQEAIVFYSSFFVKYYCAKAKNSKPSSLELNRTPSLQKIHNSKISSNLDLPHSSVFKVILSSLNFCVGDTKHIKTTENKLDLECILRTRWALFCFSPQSPTRKLSILTSISKPCPPSFTAVGEETSTVTPNFFSQVFATNSLINNIFEEQKKFVSRT